MVLLGYFMCAFALIILLFAVGIVTIHWYLLLRTVGFVHNDGRNVSGLPVVPYLFLAVAAMLYQGARWIPKDLSEASVYVFYPLGCYVLLDFFTLITIGLL